MWLVAGIVAAVLVIFLAAVLMGMSDAIAEQDDRTYGTRRY